MTALNTLRYSALVPWPGTTLGDEPEVVVMYSWQGEPNGWWRIGGYASGLPDCGHMHRTYEAAARCYRKGTRR